MAALRHGRNITRELLAQLDHDDALGRHAAPVFEHVGAVAPKILDDEQLHHPLVLLAVRSPSWCRPLSTWQPRGKSRATQFHSLVEHLLVRYRVPLFLFTALDAAPTRPADVDLFMHLAQGGSLRDALRTGLLPAAMTRAMCHRFMRTPGRCSILEAVRRAQVLELGGGTMLLRELANTFLGRELHDDAFWCGVIGWLCREDPVDPGRVGDVLDQIRHARIADPSLRADDRHLRPFARQVEDWHRTLVEHPADRTPFPTSGLAGDACITTSIVGGEQVHESWEIVELLHPADLAVESARLRHCVYSYRDRLRAGGMSIWSVRRNGRRRVTVEVWNRERRVVQIKGRKNRAPSSSELAIVSRWATKNALQVTAQ